jgi:alkaline phosphatase D
MAIDRRAFLKASAAQAALAGVGLTGCMKHPGAPGVPIGTNPFQHGVASGDPLSDRVILWTRVSPLQNRLRESIRTDWWISRDPLGLDVVAGGRTEALPERDFTIKLDPAGLEPGTDYYYGFMTRTGLSPTGRTRTLPIDSVDHVRIAFASCANYPNGYFNAYACIADRDDIDVVLHLGDYLYEYANAEYGDGTELDRIPDPIHETIDLEDYRRRHATYKSDPDLQAGHARHPWITIWDDHEVADNARKDGAHNHDSSEGDWQNRKLAAIRAYYEWMPIRELPTGLFRSFRFGDLADLVLLDTRLHGRDEQTTPRDQQAARDPSRTLLGVDQTGWLLDLLSESKARGARWRVVGQQVVVAPFTDGESVFNPDSWDGYRENRRQVLEHLEREEIDNVVFLTGDVHSSWGFDIPPPLGAGQTYDPETGAGSRAVEFVAPAVSSPAAGTFASRSKLLSGIEQRLPHLRYMNLDDHGFVILDLTPARARAEFVYTGPPSERSRRPRCGAILETLSGANHLTETGSAACGD